jgi:hypothetical protein
MNPDISEVCSRCGFNDEDYGCTCTHSDKWYACPIENKKPENIQALKETLDSYGIAHNHLPNKLIQEKKELSEILTENSTYQSAKLKKRLIDAGLKENKCEKCGNTGEWQG